MTTTFPLFAFQDGFNAAPVSHHPSIGLPVAIAVVLLIVLPFLLPKGRRFAVRGPLITLCLSLIFFAVFANSAADNPIRQPYWFATWLLMLCSIARSVYLITTKSIVAPGALRQLSRIVLDIAQGVMYLAAALIAVQVAQVPFEIAGTITKWAAVVAAFLAVMARHTVENIIAGLAIQLERPFEVEDWIQFDENPRNIGKVSEVNWRATRVLTLDQVEVTIPNSNLAQVSIRNYTKPRRYSRRSMYVVTPYDVPPRRASEIILNAVKDAYGVESFPQPSVVSNQFTDRGIEHWIRIFTTRFDERDKVDGAVRDRIWYALHREGIAIPGPIRRVELRDVNRDAIKAEEGYLQDERKQALMKVDFLEALSTEQFDRIAPSVRLRHYSEGEVIVRQGGSGTDLFIIKSGEVKATVTHEDGTELELNRMGPPQFFGEASFLTGKPRMATVAVTRDCVVFIVAKEAFQPILSVSPKLAEHISEVLANRQAELKNRLVTHENTAAEVITDHKPDLLEHIREFFSI